MVVLFIPYFVLTPLLDYDVQEDGTSQLNSQLNIKITNYGIAIAKHVMLSMNGDRNSVKFLQLTSQPIQKPVQVYSKNNQTANSFFEIAALPSHTQTIVKATLTINDTKTKLYTYVRSDETVGYHNFPIILIMYLILLLPLIIIGKAIFKSILRISKRSQVVTVNPPDGSRDVSIYSSIKARFSRPIILSVKDTLQSQILTL